MNKWKFKPGDTITSDIHSNHMIGKVFCVLYSFKTTLGAYDLYGIEWKGWKYGFNSKHYIEADFELLTPLSQVLYGG